ncbi:hypothetical protein D8674_014871 [Pyrus ussuriensis x Pyrus communis]|uniref:Uncharacterized protein n=1 Tax=Pyrus ussuriensis x Pyrus communis TaxID=2448454 RepID=A0A5N5GYZ3_9ROSA|nr:hypothetical protein D8674_014871 [Pyrus ussuriensis x Pyrus communis]
MADAGEGSCKKKLVVRLERYRLKQVPYFEGKNMAEVHAEFKYDIENLVWRDCSAEFKSWKKAPEELKKSMLGELSDKKAKANKSNRDNKTLLHLSGSRPFSYRMEVTMMEKSQSSICLSDLRPPSTSEPFQPEHGHTFAPSTFEPVDNLETFQPPLQDDHIYYAVLFS